MYVNGDGPADFEHSELRSIASTIEEKSLGATHKGGERTPLTDVVPYAGRITKRGLTVMDTPGLDVESVTGMVGGGAQVVVFTTGLGTPTGNPIAPVVKLSTNSELAARMHDIIDVERPPMATIPAYRARRNAPVDTAAG